MINVDKIMTISLRDNHLRQLSTTRELEKLNLKTEFLLVDRDPENAERGCFNSHVTVCQQALAQNCNNVLIFEDDVKVLKFQQKQIDAINDFLANHADKFDVLFLGFIVHDMWYDGLSSSRSIVRAVGTANHAYIVSRRGLEKIAQYRFQDIPFDEIMKLGLTCYSIFPMIAEQYSETILKSDIGDFRKRVRAGKDAYKNNYFWRKNYFKQWPVLLRNLPRTINHYLK